MGEIGTAAVAVAGTLMGVAVAGWIQLRAARDQRRAALRDNALAALRELAAALAAHRLAMWVREELRLSGATPGEVAEAREASHVTRAAITGPQVALTVLLPEIRTETRRAIEAVYGMRGAASTATLADHRTAAIDAADDMVAAAAKALTRR